MGVFNPLNFVKESTTLDVSASLSYRADNYDRTYFYEALNFITECNRDYMNAKKCLYKSLLEYSSFEGDKEVVTESFTDFFSKVKEIIGKFLKWIKSLFDRFITALHQLVQSDKYIVKNKDKFNKFSTEHEFSFKGYEYSLKPEIPTTSPLETFTMEFLDLSDIEFKDKEGKATDQAELAKAIKAKCTALADSLADEWYDTFRARTLNRNDGSKITQSDFANELYCIFRNGTEDKDTIEVNSSYIMACYREFDGYEKIVKQVKNANKVIESDYRDLQKKIENVISRNKDRSPQAILADLNLPTGHDIKGYTIDSSVLEALDSLMTAKVNQVQEMSNIHALAFSAKLDALSDQYKQNKSVLYKALYNIQGKPADN